MVDDDLAAVREEVRFARTAGRRITERDIAHRLGWEVARARAAPQEMIRRGELPLSHDDAGAIVVSGTTPEVRDDPTAHP